MFIQAKNITRHFFIKSIFYDIPFYSTILAKCTKNGYLAFYSAMVPKFDLPGSLGLFGGIPRFIFLTRGSCELHCSECLGSALTGHLATVVHVLVTSWLDYYNALDMGLPLKMTWILQQIQYAVARPVVPNLGPPDVLGIQLPEAFTTTSTGQDFWELKSKNIWRPKVGDH